ncbi:PWWP domain-containing protein MUM1 [Octodon degus]|uniref:PWWP domain-containing protein MUM1 n=1 Tax=Octodon degus TaxID=10160 RepID=A0A6P6EJR3_OCTDE|nr:PWWP domain-containing protein MUM1 [Octodon degus]XP_023572562.1 PWWP domain-containing protein MUM1 [Octodon degus]XP_023572563.1 PWWP domain-containing protein MUM1 [Octodon degus]XP_023572564.1 PWWP domain-containing protein MUM1 [Octodon degus]
MTDAKYVLCRWEERLWPAKVLDGPKTSTNDKGRKEFFLDVQILSLDEKIKVKSTEVETLNKSQIESIASSLALQTEVPTAALQELTYRRSLRVALDVLNEGSGLSWESTSRRNGSAWWRREKEPTEAASSLRNTLHSSFREDVSAHPGEKEPEVKVDHKKRPGKSETPGALLAPAGPQDGSEWDAGHTLTRKRGRSLAQRSGQCQEAPAPSGAQSEEQCVGQASLPQAQEDDLCAQAEGHDPGLPLGSLTVVPALDRAGGPPAKRMHLRLPATQLEPELSPKPRPWGYMTLRSTSTSPCPSDTAVEDTQFPLLQDSGSDGLEEDLQASQELVEFNSNNSIMEEEEEEEEEEPPRILLYHEPRSFEVGMLVWLKYQKYPFWPAVVKSVKRREKKASVLFIERDMNPKGRGITVSLRRLKHFDCKEKQALLDKAREDFDQAIGCCVSLITDYRVRLGCGSFAGSFLEYFAADISYPVRKSIQQNAEGTRFPQLSRGDPEEPEGSSPLEWRLPCRKVLPDRSRAARDRANQRLVEYIVKARGAESHLHAILKHGKPSRWLKMFLSSGQYVMCLETYLEDEEQLDRVVKYLQGVYQDVDGDELVQASGDRIRFILDVLLPEAIICAISAVDSVDYKTAEEKYIRGPSLGYREKQIFDNQVLEERSRRHQ